MFLPRTLIPKTKNIAPFVDAGYYWSGQEDQHQAINFFPENLQKFSWEDWSTIDLEERWKPQSSPCMHPLVIQWGPGTFVTPDEGEGAHNIDGYKCLGSSYPTWVPSAPSCWKWTWSQALATPLWEEGRPVIPGGRIKSMLEVGSKWWAGLESERKQCSNLFLGGFGHHGLKAGNAPVGSPGDNKNYIAFTAGHSQVKEIFFPSLAILYWVAEGSLKLPRESIST